MDKLGDNIRRIRVLFGFKQATIARMINLSVNSYGKIERNEVAIKPENLERIAKILDIDSRYIINFSQLLEKMKESQH